MSDLENIAFLATVPLPEQAPGFPQPTLQDDPYADPPIDVAEMRRKRSQGTFILPGTAV
jgi:hypothetical protein